MINGSSGRFRLLPVGAETSYDPVPFRVSGAPAALPTGSPPHPSLEGVVRPDVSRRRLGASQTTSDILLSPPRLSL
jgi:hypothetical protein